MKFNKSILWRAEELFISEDDLQVAYRKGYAAWEPGKVPGSTPEQLGMAVVEQFLEIKQETLVEAQQEKLGNTDPVPVDDPDSRDEKAKDAKNAKSKPKSYKKFAKDSKYNNQQPGPQADSGRSGGVPGGAIGFYSIETVLPDNESIKAWMLSEKTQADYTKRYGSKAAERLLEAANKLVASLGKVEEAFVPVKDPRTNFPQGTREYADEMLAHHKKMMDEYFGKDKAGYEFHKSASLQYVKKKEVAKSAFPYHDRKETKKRYDEVMKKKR
jgi:hypothetical protein